METPGIVKLRRPPQQSWGDSRWMLEDALRRRAAAVNRELLRHTATLFARVPGRTGVAAVAAVGGIRRGVDAATVALGQAGIAASGALTIIAQGSAT